MKLKNKRSGRMALRNVAVCSTIFGAAAAGSAHGSVELYGLVDTGLNYQKRAGRSTTGIESGLMSNSRFGLRGTEALTKDIKAFFVLESGFSSDTGQSASASSFFNRFALLGLEHRRYGKVTFGRGDVLTATWVAGTVNPFSLNFKTASLGTTFGYNDERMAGGRVNNAAHYYSPELAGWQVGAGYSFEMFGNEAAGAGNNSRLVDLAVKYDKGPLRAVLSYQVINSPRSSEDDKTLIVGGRYRFDSFDLHAGYQAVRNLSIVNGYNGAVATRRQFVNDNAWTVGVSVPIGAGQVYADFQQARDSKAKGSAIAYSYNLSKRTNLYTYYSRSRSWNFDAGVGVPVTQVALGMRHRF